jgi:coenzyme F420-reducing hydrogenase alpha subunit
VVTSTGRAFEVADFGTHVVEEHVARSNALHARLDDQELYVVGPLARYALNHDQLGPLAQEAARDAGLGDECRNPFQSIVVRAVELVQATDEALRIIDSWDGASAPSVDVPPRAGTGHGATEAPRGLLYHRYELAEDGTILDATIIPPTSQNQASIEQDLRAFVQARLELPHDELVGQCEQAIRNYDPCISCATHFLEQAASMSADASVPSMSIPATARQADGSRAATSAAADVSGSAVTTSLPGVVHRRCPRGFACACRSSTSPRSG